MEPAEAVHAVEVSLRTLINSVLGAQWLLTQGINVPELERQRKSDGKKRDGTVISDDLLAYTYLKDLRLIIERHWDQFQPALGDAQRFAVYFDGSHTSAMHPCTAASYGRLNGNCWPALPERFGIKWPSIEAR